MMAFNFAYSRLRHGLRGRTASRLPSVAWQPWRIAVFFGAYFAAIGVFAPYFPLYLQYRGLSAAQIGIVMGLSQGMRILGPNVWGWLADHVDDRLRILRFTSAAAAVCFLPLLFPGGFGFVLMTMFAMQFFMTGQIPVAEAITSAHLRDDSHAAARYGRIRVWGSITFVLLVLTMGPLFDWQGIAVQPWVVLALLILTAAAGLLVRDAPHPAEVESPVSVRSRLDEPRVRWFFASILLMIFAHGAMYTYLSLHLAGLGYSKTAIGVFWVLGVLMEIGFFSLQGRVFARFDTFRILEATFMLAALRFALIAEFAHVVVVLAFAQMLHAASFAVHHSASVLTIQRWFPGRAAARGQALYISIGYGVGGTGGSLTAAWLWSTAGPAAAFFSSSAAALVGLWAVRRARALDRIHAQPAHSG
jgi:PPP family 3-phenylpropionic acid transporter